MQIEQLTSRVARYGPVMGFGVSIFYLKLNVSQE